MQISLGRLKKFFQNIDVGKRSQPDQKIYAFSNHALLEICLASLMPYVDIATQFPEDIVSLKITEAIAFCG